MTTFGGITQPLLMTPANGTDPFPTFTNSPFTFADAFLDYTGSAHFNLQFSFNGGNNQLESQEGVFPGVQYSIFRPGQNPGPTAYSVVWFANFAGDAPNSFFPAQGTPSDINGNNNVGFVRPAIGSQFDGTFIMRGYATLTPGTILAQAKYRIRYIRA